MTFSTDSGPGPGPAGECGTLDSPRQAG